MITGECTCTERHVVGAGPAVGVLQENDDEWIELTDTFGIPDVNDYTDLGIDPYSFVE